MQLYNEDFELQEYHRMIEYYKNLKQEHIMQRYG